MENAVNVHVIVEITDSEHKKLTFHQREVAVHQIKEAAGLPLDTELALKREGELDRLANSEKLTLREGERFLVIHKDFLLIVNGKEKVWHEKHISYRQVVELYFGPGRLQESEYDLRSEVFTRSRKESEGFNGRRRHGSREVGNGLQCNTHWSLVTRTSKGCGMMD